MTLLQELARVDRQLAYDLLYALRLTVGADVRLAALDNESSDVSTRLARTARLNGAMAALEVSLRPSGDLGDRDPLDDDTA